jgi:hypothetical protein
MSNIVDIKCIENGEINWGDDINNNFIACKNGVEGCAEAEHSHPEKADIGHLHTEYAEVGLLDLKVNQTELDGLVNVVETKTNNTDFNELVGIVNGKATKTEFNGLVNVVNSKAELQHTHLANDIINLGSLGLDITNWSPVIEISGHDSTEESKVRLEIRLQASAGIGLDDNTIKIGESAVGEEDEEIGDVGDNGEFFFFFTIQAQTTLPLNMIGLNYYFSKTLNDGLFNEYETNIYNSNEITIKKPSKSTAGVWADTNETNLYLRIRVMNPFNNSMSKLLTKRYTIVRYISMVEIQNDILASVLPGDGGNPDIHSDS